MKLDVTWLKNNHQMIHYFGLGFIQLKIDKNTRLHFYNKKLPPIVSKEDIHNHRYDFTSEILLGTLIQEIYEVVPGDTHYLEDESCQVDVKVESKPKLCSVQMSSRHIHSPKSSYLISHTTFHRVYCDFECITLLNRTDYKKQLAQVIRPIEGAKVCPFSQKVKEEYLWNIIEEMLK